MTTSAPITNQLATRLAAIAVTLLFVVNGVVIGGFGGSLPSLRDKLGLDATQIAIMLFCAGVAAILSMQIGGRVADAIGAREVSLAAVPFLIVGMITIGLAPAYPIAIVGAMVIGLGNGAMDVAMNAIGVQVEAARQRPIMSFFHAFWSIGTFIGAGAILLLATLLGLKGGEIVTPLSISIAAMSLLALGILLKITPEAAVVHHTVDGVRTPIPAVAWILGVMALAFGLSEGTATDWSSLHVTDVAGVDPTTGALGLVAVSAFMVVIRLLGDRLVVRFGRRAVVRFGGLCAALGYLTVTLVEQPAAPGGRLGLGWLRRRDDCTAGLRRSRAHRRRPGARSSRDLRLCRILDRPGRGRFPGKPAWDPARDGRAGFALCRHHRTGIHHAARGCRARHQL